MEKLRDKAELFTLVSIFLFSVIALTPVTWNMLYVTWCYYLPHRLIT